MSTAKTELVLFKYVGTVNKKSEFLIEDEKLWMFLHGKKAHFMVVLKFCYHLFWCSGKLDLLGCKEVVKIIPTKEHTFLN